MPILNPIHTLSGSHELNKLIQAYNLLPHDNKVKRTASLQAIVVVVDALKKIPDTGLSAWMKEPAGIQAHLDYYKVKNTSPAVDYKKTYVNQTKQEQTPEGDQPSLKH